MQGYGLMIDEACSQCAGNPSHIFVQGGVGGLAAAACSYLWERYGKERPVFVVVEPERADCLFRSAVAGRPTPAHGTLDTIMGGLACGEVSLLAWRILATGADAFATIDDEAAAECMRLLAEGRCGDDPIVAGEFAVAGLAGLLLACADTDARSVLGLRPDSRVLVLGTEGATDADTYRTIVGRTPDEVMRGLLRRHDDDDDVSSRQCPTWPPPFATRSTRRARSWSTLCGRLVATASVNPPGRTAEAAEVVRGYLAGHGMASEIVAGRRRGAQRRRPHRRRSGADRHVVFNAHMDTMEAGDESSWSVPVMRSRAATGASTASAWAT